jgi:hypothetical protein
MEWINGLEVIGLIVTAGLLFALVKELKKNIKDSNDGKQSEKCDLD